MKEKLGKRILKNFCIFFIYIYIVELIARFNIGSSFADWAMLRITLSTVLIALIISLIISHNNKWWRNIAATLIALFIMIYAWAEVNLYHYLGFFMGAANADQGTKVTEFIKDYLQAAKLNTYLVIIPFILLVLYYWWISKKLRIKKLHKTIMFDYKKEKALSYTLTYLIIFLVLTVLGVGYYSTLKLGFMQNQMQQPKNEILFIYPENANLSVSQFGVLMYGATDMISQFLNIEIEDEFINNSHGGHHNNPGTVNPDYTRNIDDYSWEKVIENEKDQNKNKINKYLINREVTPKNEYTGLFEGKNLIFILMESVNEIAINEEYFPTLYKLYNEGFSFQNNYTPRNSCSTGNNEMTSMTSLYTINYTCTANAYKNNKYFQAVFNAFNREGYTTSSYHNYGEFYYYRRTIHPNMGSMAYYDAPRLSINWSMKWPSDVDLVEKATPLFITEENFMAYITTVSTHQVYTEWSNMGNKHIDDFKDTKYSTPVKRYLSKMRELDHAMARLLELLEESGKLEDTVIALFADHYPYGLTTNQINEVLPYNVKNYKEVDRTPMMIYNAGTEGKAITKYTTIIDMLPTLLNLFNVDYDPRYYFGHDIFSDYDDRAIFMDGSWQDSIGYYSSTSGKFTPLNDENKTYTKEELVEINSDINAKQKMSALIIRNNYFNYLDNALKKYPKPVEEVPLPEVTEE